MEKYFTRPKSQIWEYWTENLGEKANVQRLSLSTSKKCEEQGMNSELHRYFGLWIREKGGKGIKFWREFLQFFFHSGAAIPNFLESKFFKIRGSRI